MDIDSELIRIPSGNLLPSTAKYDQEQGWARLIVITAHRSLEVSVWNGGAGVCEPDGGGNDLASSLGSDIRIPLEREVAD